MYFLVRSVSIADCCCLQDWPKEPIGMSNGIFTTFVSDGLAERTDWSLQRHVDLLTFPN